MTTISNGESGLSVRNKINNVFQHVDGSASELVINEAGADVNFRVESDTNANALFVDGSTGNVGIGTSSPGGRLSVVAPTGSGILDIVTGSETADSIRLAAGGSVTNWLEYRGYLGHIWFDNVGERMRIDSSGNLLVGTTTSGGEGVTVSGAFGQIRQHSPGTSAAQITQFIKNGTQVGNITVTTSATAYNITSDYRLKEDVQPMVGASDRVLSLNPVNFAWKADGSRTDGFIAHEVQEVAPYAVTGEKDGEEMQAMDHSKLVPLLTAALQEALQKIEALEARITALEA